MAPDSQHLHSTLTVNVNRILDLVPLAPAMGKPLTSCDNCRRARLGCNATLQPGQPCFNCARKGVKCMTKPSTSVTKRQARILSARPKSSGTSLAVDKPSADAPCDDCAGAPSPVTSHSLSHSGSFQPISSVVSSDSMARSQQAQTLHNLLWNVFTSLLEPRIGLWIGGAGCPFMTSNAVRSITLRCQR